MGLGGELKLAGLALAPSDTADARLEQGTSSCRRLLRGDGVTDQKSGPGGWQPHRLIWTSIRSDGDPGRPVSLRP